MRTVSSTFEQFTLGIEEEFQIVDPQTREMRSHVSEISKKADVVTNIWILFGPNSLDDNRILFAGIGDNLS